MDPQLLLPTGAGLIVEQVLLCDEIVHLTVRCEAAGAQCPKCGTWSEAFHSSYERNLGDLPIAGRQAVIDLRVRRFRCYQAECARKTFVEQAPVLAERYAHRTRRLRSLLEEIGLALGGRPGSRHCQRLAMPTCRSTLLRMVRALPERAVLTPTVLGVDGFAFRKGRRYGTILVDADAHRIVDLLEDPSADALVEWLRNHPGAKVICRDRDGVYASAARRGAPEALQVADRWHLVHNLADALERFAVRVLAGVRKELKAGEAADTTSSEIPPSLQAASLSPCRLKERTVNGQWDLGSPANPVKTQRTRSARASVSRAQFGPSIRARRSGSFARPYPALLISFTLVMWPSTGPVLHGYRKAFVIAPGHRSYRPPDVRMVSSHLLPHPSPTA